jgi:hypothetical protein
VVSHRIGWAGRGCLEVKSEEPDNLGVKGLAKGQANYRHHGSLAGGSGRLKTEVFWQCPKIFVWVGFSWFHFLESAN